MKHPGYAIGIGTGRAWREVCCHPYKDMESQPPWLRPDMRSLSVCYTLFCQLFQVMADTTNTGPFSTSTAFCARCGSILPLLQEFGSVKCYACKAICDPNSKYTNFYFFHRISMDFS